MSDVIMIQETPEQIDDSPHPVSSQFPSEPFFGSNLHFRRLQFQLRRLQFQLRHFPIFPEQKLMWRPKRTTNITVICWYRSHMLHVWNIYLHLPEQNHPNVGKYTIHGAYGDCHLICFFWLQPIRSDFGSQVALRPARSCLSRARSLNDRSVMVTTWCPPVVRFGDSAISNNHH